MVVLLVIMGIGAIWMTASLPAWKQQATREKEAELEFRGRQYVRALSLWERRNGPGTRPANVDMLVESKMLRKKYKDPITGEDFLPVMVGSPQAGAPGGAQTPPGATPPGGGRAGGNPAPGGQQPGGGQTFGGQLFGVASKSTAASIKVYNGKTRYNEWEFLYVGGRAGGPAGGPGQGGPGQGGPGVGGPGRGGPGGGGPGIGGPGRGGPTGGTPPGPGRGGPGGTPAGPGRGRGGQ
jgi:hypothetical protein